MLASENSKLRWKTLETFAGIPVINNALRAVFDRGEKKLDSLIERNETIGLACSKLLFGMYLGANVAASCTEKLDSALYRGISRLDETANHYLTGAVRRFPMVQRSWSNIVNGVKKRAAITGGDLLSRGLKTCPVQCSIELLDTCLWSLNQVVLFIIPSKKSYVYDYVLGTKACIEYHKNGDNVPIQRAHACRAFIKYFREFSSSMKNVVYKTSEMRKFLKNLRNYGDDRSTWNRLREILSKLQRRKFVTPKKRLAQNKSPLTAIKKCFWDILDKIVCLLFDSIITGDFDFEPPDRDTDLFRRAEIHKKRKHESIEDDDEEDGLMPGGNDDTDDEARGINQAEDVGRIYAQFCEYLKKMDVHAQSDDSEDSDYVPEDSSTDSHEVIDGEEEETDSEERDTEDDDDQTEIEELAETAEEEVPIDDSKMAAQESAYTVRFPEDSRAENVVEETPSNTDGQETKN